ncbi:hypothetical protein BHM03_00051808 [Ensete ventricosum]|uniref:Uncharacterized protein n=1 Tax=Ensete ventricosum TaxID=4639 RepID=A0A445MLX3_ENSVE|nr:hypothetical protein BHM03_00051808 [Ensete ventricosum]
MACFRLSRGQAGNYLAAHSGFRVSGAPSSNKGWKSRVFFISYHRGWSFPTEWTSRMVNSSVPVLSADEIELVEILRGILSISRGVKDMNEAWLVEAGLSLAPGGDVEASTVEKCPSSEARAGLRKRLLKAATEQPVDTSGSTEKTFVDKGKGIVELEEVPERGGALHPILTKQVYECSSEELMNHAGKSAVWPAKELEQEVGLLHSSLDGARNDRARLEGDVLLVIEAAAFLEVELKAEGPKAVAAYKASRGFESILEKMGRVSYEFGYRVALKQHQGKHPEITIEQDPFAECPGDANVKMDLDQPFDDGTPSEKQPTL